MVYIYLSNVLNEAVHQVFDIKTHLHIKFIIFFLQERKKKEQGMDNIKIYSLLKISRSNLTHGIN